MTAIVQSPGPQNKVEAQSLLLKTESINVVASDFKVHMEDYFLTISSIQALDSVSHPILLLSTGANPHIL